MKDRIELLIKAKNMTAAQFADEIGVQKSSISHILSGRNNASLDFIQKILLTYQDVNMEWLMFGKGPVFKTSESVPKANNDNKFNAVQPMISGAVDLFSAIVPDDGKDFRTENALKPEVDVEVKTNAEETEMPAPVSEGESSAGIKNTEEEKWDEKPSVGNRHKNTSTKTIVKIVEFYSDNTFREYYPAE